ncbi:MAG TPA: O-antigen ligase family protein [Bryobacteraceae bacterium]|nr:O-antigen ligase family protein [Bryobacteraceae bacterium]
MSILLPALVFLLPVLITPGLLFHYDVTPKVTILSLLVAGCLAFPGAISSGIAALWSRRSGRWLCALAAAQSLWYAAASGLSSRPWFSLLGSNWRRMGLLTIVALSVFAVLAAAYLSRWPERLPSILRAFVAATIVASVYGILQYFDIDPLQAGAAYHAEAGDSIIVRPPGTLGHADYFGWWLAIALFCSVASARIETALWKGLAIFACVLSGAAIVLSGTRSAILAVLVGFLAMAVFSGFRPGRKHLLAGLLFVAFFAAFYFSPAGTRLQARVRWSGDEPTGGARPLLWRDSLRMAAAKPWVGFGPETFAAEFSRYQSVELARLLPDFYYESPHNTALDALTSEGIPGLLIAFGWIVVGIWACFRVNRTQSKPGAALFAALVASCVASLFTAATAGPIFATLLVIAMLVALEPVSFTSPIIKPVAVLAFSVPIAVCLALFGAALAMDDFQLARFQSDAGDTGNSIVRYNSLVRTELPGAAEDLYASRRLATICGAGANGAVQTACVVAATRAARRATGTSDNPPNAWYNLGMFSAEQNDEANVEISLRRSASLAPNWFKPHWALAKLLVLTGRLNDAKKEARRAFQLDAGKDAEVRETMRSLTEQRP